MVTNVYVDGFNLFYGALKGTPYKWLDLGALCARLFPQDEIQRIRYFTARVTARPTDVQLPVRQDAYLRALATVPGLTIHEGEFKVSYPMMPRYDPGAPGVPAGFVQVIKTAEKGSDVNLATYAMLDACRQDCQAIAVITNDSDLSEPLRIIRAELGLVVGVVNPHPARRRSRALTASFFKQLRVSALRQCQFPAEVTDGAGRVIRKPDGW